MRWEVSISAFAFAIAGLWSTAGFAQIGVIECRTDSRGYAFSDLGRDYGYTRESVVRQCQSHPSTRNADCVYNVSCSGESRLRVVCDTFSRGLSFRNESLDHLHAREITIQDCKSHPSTINADCEYNVGCYEGSGSIHRPGPIPQPIPPIVVRPRPPVVVHPPIGNRRPAVVRPTPRSQRPVVVAPRRR